MTIENPEIEKINSIASEETEAQREARHIQEEGQHIREFMFLQRDFILRQMEKVAVPTAEFDDFFVKNWGVSQSERFRAIFRAIRDEEENHHENLWDEVKSEAFRDRLLHRIEKEFETKNGEPIKMAA